MANRKRAYEVKCRLSDEEYQYYQSKLKESGLTSQEYLLTAIMGIELPKSILLDALIPLNRSLNDIYRLLRGIDIEIKQSEKNINFEHIASDLNQLKKEVIDIWQLLRQLMAENLRPLH